MLAVSVFGSLTAATPAAAQSAPGVGAWQPGPAASGDRNSLAGVIDVPANGASLQMGNLTIGGWVVDLTAQGWTGIDDVEIFVGTMDGGGRPLGHAQFQVNRPDVANALKNGFWTGAGFTANISTLGLPAGVNALSVYAHTPSRGWWFRPVNITLRASTTPPPAAPAPSPTGNDISFPQCPTGAEPPLPAFAIVGVTGGRPFTPNPCLAREFVWALTSTSSTQPHVGLYMNTANPGPDSSANWPKAGTMTPKACDGSWSNECAYDYGWASAQDAYSRAVGVSGDGAAQYEWWLDVESANSWSTQMDANAATLQGVIDSLHAASVASVGIYSTSTDWEALIGPPASSSPFGGLLNWRPGPSGPQDAPSWCGRSVTGGRVKFVQFPIGGFDTDLPCF